MGKFSKEKGKRGERDFVHFCQQFPWLVELQRRLTSTPIRRSAQVKGTPDSPDVEGLPGLHVEVKRRERLNVYEALEQAVREAKEGEIPLVAFRRNRKPWLVILQAEDFFEQFYRLFLENKLSSSIVEYKEVRHHGNGSGKAPARIPASFE